MIEMQPIWSSERLTQQRQALCLHLMVSLEGSGGGLPIQGIIHKFVHKYLLCSCLSPLKGKFDHRTFRDRPQERPFLFGSVCVNVNLWAPPTIRLFFLTFFNNCLQSPKFSAYCSHLKPLHYPRLHTNPNPVIQQMPSQPTCLPQSESCPTFYVLGYTIDLTSVLDLKNFPTKFNLDFLLSSQ